MKLLISALQAYCLLTIGCTIGIGLMCLLSINKPEKEESHE
ncbi:MAG: hypothetical protein ACRCTD_17465 [Beijerinckiaceae bacterium]